MNGRTKTQKTTGILNLGKNQVIPDQLYLFVICYVISDQTFWNLVASDVHYNQKEDQGLIPHSCYLHCMFFLCCWGIKNTFFNQINWIASEKSYEIFKNPPSIYISPPYLQLNSIYLYLSNLIPGSTIRLFDLLGACFMVQKVNSDYEIINVIGFFIMVVNQDSLLVFI